MHRPFALCLTAAALLLQPAATHAQSPDALRITFLDVGQGDAVLVQSPQGQTALIDAGPGRPLVPLLQSLGVEQIDLLVASHPHADHIGGMLGVLNGMPVRFYVDNGEPYTTATYGSLMAALEARPDVTYLQATPRTLSLGEAEIQVLPMPPPGTSINDRSVGLVVRYGSFSAFLSGDSEVGELAYFLNAGVVPDVEVLKAPHHGSANGYTPAFLQAARPEVVVISVGSNSYGHPMPEALNAYASIASEVHRTDREGSVTVEGYADGTFRVYGQQPPSTFSALVLGVFADAPGNDHQNLNGEYAYVRSTSSSALDVGGWMLCDAARHCFRFPEGASLPAGGQLIVFTGPGVADGVRFFMNSRSAVWNNTGDNATLTDAGGRVVARYVYD